jgi:hypothetical protein
MKNKTRTYSSNRNIKAVCSAVISVSAYKTKVYFEVGVCLSSVPSVPFAFTSAQTALYLTSSYLGSRRSATLS